METANLTKLLKLAHNKEFYRQYIKVIIKIYVIYYNSIITTSFYFFDLVIREHVAAEVSRLQDADGNTDQYLQFLKKMVQLIVLHLQQGQMPIRRGKKANNFTFSYFMFD